MSLHIPHFFLFFDAPLITFTLAIKGAKKTQICKQRKGAFSPLSRYIYKQLDTRSKKSNIFRSKVNGGLWC